MDRADLTAIAELRAEDVRATMPPYPQWFAGRAALTAFHDPGLFPAFGLPMSFAAGDRPPGRQF